MLQPRHDSPAAAQIEGNLLQLGADHQIAIYRRDGACWVAEFRHGRGELTDATTWFRVPAGALLSCHRWRAAVLDTMQPLTPEFIDKIEQLHRPRARVSADRPDVVADAVSTAKRWLARWAARIAAMSSARRTGAPPSPCASLGDADAARQA